MPKSRRFSATNRLRLAIALLALCLSVVVGYSRVGVAVDRAIDPVRAQLAHHAASGQVVIVELDAASAAAIKRWPWPRDNYAKVVDHLRSAGAASINFDIDLSSPSTDDGDAAFASALARSDGIVALPTFGQRARSGDERGLDAMPLPMFREHGTMVSVSIAPDSDGAIRRAPFGTVTGGLPRPSLSAYAAGRSGEADTFFPIDFGIEPTSIPRLSFIAVRDGHFDPASVRGKTVIVGATAIEMGDRYAVPHWGVIPGVVVQALATESLGQGLPHYGGGIAMIGLAALFAAAILWARSALVRIGAAIAAPLILFATALFCQLEWHLFVPIAGALSLLMVAIAGAIGLQFLRTLDHQRQVDDATGLPNRSAMLTHLAAARDPGVAVMHIGNWESLLTVLGPEAERDLILRLSERLRLVAADGRVYRIANRLIAFVPTFDDDDDALAGLRAMLLQPIEVVGRRVDANVTIGFGVGPVASALSEATLAAEEASQQGVFWRHADTDRNQLERDISLMGELDEAIGRGEIELHYQPKLDLRSNRIVSCEALVRWRHPVRGFIRPDLFIPLAEQSDRIELLTLHIIRQAAEDLAAWRSQGHRLTVAINISARLVTSDGFNAKVATLLDQNVVPADTLVFEITESATMADPQAAAAALSRYRDLGIAISMDDYGTGQSTLSYLRNLPLTELKIDRSFVQFAHINRNDGLMVRSTIDLAHAIGLKVVAEGIEDSECLAFLRTAECDLAQGYLISKPVPADAFVGLLGERAIAA
jgi:EAL domain-containing protein (putative c-di-GMP-specific phosphodiesterase class I)/CHASE2 domain-containing sensor protein